MIYFNPKRPIVVRVEASYHDGLSAGLFQKNGSGLQPVHYISRTMTDTEKRYSQTEKDALAIRWAKNRFKMYLLGRQDLKSLPHISLYYQCLIKPQPSCHHVSKNG